MKAVGIDLGASSIKAAAVEVFEDGDCSILETLSIRSADIPSELPRLIAMANRYRPSPFTHVRLGLTISNPDVFLNRVRIKLPPETYTITEQEIRTLFFQQKIPMPAETKPAEDLWDFEVLSLRRRAADLAELGSKHADGLFVKIPRAAYDSATASLKGIQAGHITPSSLSILDFALKFPQPENQSILFLDLGAAKIDMMAAMNSELLKTNRVPVAELFTEIATHAKLTDPKQIEQRLRDADVLANNSVDSAINAVLSGSLKKVRDWLSSEENKDVPPIQRVILCGSLAPVKGMVRLVHSILNIHCETLTAPEQVRTSLSSFPAELPVYAAAVGAAMRAAGVTKYALEPRRVSLRKVGAHGKPVKATETGRTELHGATGTEGTGITDFRTLVANSRTWAVGFFSSARKTARELPSRLGVVWTLIGIAAALAIVPTIMLYRAEGRRINEAVRDIRKVAPGFAELARQAALIEEYKSILQTGALDLLPWGEVIKETVAVVPPQAYVTNIKTNRERMLVVGRLRGNITQQLNRMAEKMRESPILSRQGLVPPVF